MEKPVGTINSIKLKTLNSSRYDFKFDFTFFFFFYLYLCGCICYKSVRFCFFLHLGTQKWQANQPCWIMATSKGILGHNLLNFRVKAWVKLWVRLRITQAVVMVMVWEHLQAMNPSVCNVLISDENKVHACAACLPIEFLYPVLYNISRPHWFWNKHLPSRELGSPAKFVWSVCSRFLCLRWKYLFALPSGRLCAFFPSLVANRELRVHWLSD